MFSVQNIDSLCMRMDMDVLWLFSDKLVVSLLYEYTYTYTVMFIKNRCF